MSKLTPIFASEKAAAELLDMAPADFRDLVASGHLPRGREIAPGLVRWDAEQLRALGRGDAVDGGINW